MTERWRRHLIGVAAMVAVPFVASALTQRVALPADGIVSGVILDETATPVANARVDVTAMGSGDRRTFTTSTADDGAFEVRGLSAGVYSLAMSKPGHAGTRLGAMQPWLEPTTIPLGPSQTRTIRGILPHAAVISGVVLDQRGQPRPGARVEALLWTVRQGVPQLITATRTASVPVTDSTGPDGTFRLHGLLPGRYLVRASGSFGTNVAYSSDPDRRLVFPPVYHPSATSPGSAETVALSPGEHVGGLVLRLQAVPAGSVQVDVVNPVQVAPLNLSVEWGTDEWRDRGTVRDRYERRGVPDETGSFVMHGLPEGHHVITAHATFRFVPDQPTLPSLWASTRVYTTAGDDRVQLLLQRGAEVRGHFVVLPSSDQPTDLSEAHLSLRTIAGPFAERMGLVYEHRPVGGGFLTVNVPEGEYRLEPQGLGAGWTVAAADLNGVPLEDNVLRVRQGEDVTSLTVVITNLRTELSGTVRCASSVTCGDAPVVVYPAEPALRTYRSPRIALTQPDIDGTYVLEDLPAGDYLVAAVLTDWHPLLEPALLESLRGISRPVSIRFGEPVSLDLTRR